MDIFDIVAASARAKPPPSASLAQSSGDSLLRARAATGVESGGGQSGMVGSFRPGKPSRLNVAPITQKTRPTIRSPRHKRGATDYLQNASRLDIFPANPMLADALSMAQPNASNSNNNVSNSSINRRGDRKRTGASSSDSYEALTAEMAAGQSISNLAGERDYRVVPQDLSNHQRDMHTNLTTGATSYALQSLSSLDAKGIVRDVTQATDAAATDDWTRIAMTVLPLFNGEAVHGCMEDLAALVKQCAHDRDRITLLNDFTRILGHGMLTLNSQLHHLPSEDALLPWLADTWHFFHTDVLAYLLCVFMPLQATLNRRPNDLPVNVREQILVSFRDQVFLPISERVIAQFTKIPATADEDTRDTMARIVQMTGLLCNLSASAEHRRRVVAAWHAFMRRWHVVLAQQRDVRRPNVTWRRWTRTGTAPIPTTGRRRG